MSANKKIIRKKFRDDCFERDNYSCVMCGFKSAKETAEKELDAHHIVNRNHMPSGGYVKQNGISLCQACHRKAEQFYETGMAYPGYSVDELFKKINSSYELALRKAKLL